MKIIATDFDGTLYRNHEITQRDYDAIKAWQKNGNLFGIVTGRGDDIIETAQELHLTLDYAIAYNGALILDGCGNVLYEDCFSAALVKEYYDFAYESGLAFAREKPQIDPNDTGKRHQVGLLMATDADAVKLAELLNEKFSGRLISYPNGEWINTVKDGVSKATGIAHYAEMKGVVKNDIWVVGDHYNDLPMLKAYDGYIVSTAVDGMKKLIPNVCEDIAHLSEIAGN